MARTLLITGASSGIGAATAKAAAGAGWQVALAARSKDRLDALAAEIGDAALAVECDVTDPASVASAVGAAVDRFGGLDAAFANAGMGTGADPSDDDVRRLVDVNVMGVLWTARAAMPELRKTKGTLVLTGSAAGRTHIDGSVYGATKWFVHGLGGNLAGEMRGFGGRCCVVAPGMVNTAFFDEAKPEKIQPDDVARAVLHAIEAPDTVAVREIFLMTNDS